MWFLWYSSMSWLMWFLWYSSMSWLMWQIVLPFSTVLTFSVYSGSLFRPWEQEGQMSETSKMCGHRKMF